MGLYKMLEKSSNNKILKNYESIIKMINQYYSDISKIYKEEIDLNYQIDSCIRNGRESFNEYLGGYLSSKVVDKDFLSLVNAIDSYSFNKQNMDKCYRLIDSLIENSNIVNKEQLLRKDWTKKIESLIDISNNSSKIEYNNVYLFLIGTMFIKEYKQIFNEIKPTIDKNVLEGKTYIESIRDAIDSKKILIDDKKILSTFYTIRNREIDYNNKLRELYKDKYINNFFISETNKLRRKVEEEILNGKDKELLLKEILPYAYALVKCACEYKKGLIAYDVQLMGAIALNDGKISEMYTGEGKTLTAIFAAYLNSLIGKEVDIFTPNDYLSRRDAKSNEGIYNLLGLDVGCVLVDNQTIEDKKKAYLCDVVYGSSTAFAFDYLKDTIVSPNEMVMKNINPGFVIVDEADQILINNALNPYRLTGGLSLTKQDLDDNKNAKYYINLALNIEKILSKSKYIAKSDYEYECITGDNKEYTLRMGDKYSLLVGQNDVYLTLKGEKELFYYLMYDKALDLVESASSYFKESEEYLFGEDYLFRGEKLVLTVEGFDKACRQINEFSNLNMSWLTDEDNQIIRKYLSNALIARYIVKKGKDYEVVINNKSGRKEVFVLQDGRIMPDSKFSDGLHQAIEVKEGLEIKVSTKERLLDSPLATISNRALLYRYDKISGMTGTACVSAFKQIYGLDTFSVPKNKEYQYEKGIIAISPFKRKDHPVVLCKNNKIKMEHIVIDTMNSYLKGQPVLLVGDNNEVVEKVYNSIIKLNPKIGVQLLISSKNLEEEAEIISKAGSKGAITVSSEMAGRGTDIKLGGEEAITKEKIIENIFLEEVNEVLRKNNIKEEQSLIDIVLESLRLQYKEDEAYRKIIDDKVQKEILNVTRELYELGGLKYIQINPFRTTRNDKQGKGRVSRCGEPGETIMYVTLDDLKNIGVNNDDLKLLSELIEDSDIINDYEANGKISEIIEFAQLSNENNDNIRISSTDTMDLAMSSIGTRILNERKNIILGNDITTHLENSIKTVIDNLLLENVPKKKKNVISKENYRLIRTSLDYDCLEDSVKSVFGVEIDKEQIFKTCTDVSDLKEFIYDKTNMKLDAIKKTTTNDKFNKKIREVFLEQINNVYKEFLDSAKIVELQKFNDSIGKNNNTNRIMYLESIYTECYNYNIKKTIKSIFRPNLKEKIEQPSKEEVVLSKKLPTIDELVTKSSK